MKKILILLTLIFSIALVSGASSLNQFIGHIYENVTDGSFNQSKWTNTSSSSGTGSASLTETTDYLVIRSDTAGAGTGLINVNTSVMPPLAQLKGLKMNVSLEGTTAGGTSLTASFKVFGTQLASISGSTSDRAIWSIVLNDTNPSFFDVYRNSVFNRSISPANNIINFNCTTIGAAGPDTGTCFALLRTIDYYDSRALTLTYPENNSFVGTSNVNLNASTYGIFNLTLLNATVTVFNSSGVYSRNNTNLSGTPQRNISLWMNLPIGSYSYTYNIWATNGTSNYTFETGYNYTFTSGFVLRSTTYTSPIFEVEADTLTLNLTIVNGSSLTGATLIYNNTNYASTINQNGNNYSIVNSIVTPSVSSNTNVSFYWNISIYDGSNTFYATTPILNQSVINLMIDNCTVNSNQILNYTIYDEDTLTFLTSSTYNTTTDLLVRLSSDFTGENYIYYTNQTTSNPIQICISSTLATGRNYRLDSDVRFSSSSRVTEYHIIENLTINTTAVPVAYNLYDLLITNSQEFILNVKDSNFLPVQGAIIEIQRQYLSQGTFLPVEIVRTDIDGRGLAHLVLGDEVYTFYVRKDGELLGTFPNVRAVCQDITTSNCQINLNSVIGLSSIETLKEINGVRYSLSFNRNTSVVTLNFISSAGDAKDMRLLVIRSDLYNNLTICNNTLVASSGQLTCTVSSSYGNISIQAEVYSDSVMIARQTYQIGQQIYQFLDKTRYLLAVILVITLPLMSVGSPVIALVFFVIGLILAGALFMVDFGGALGFGGALIWLMLAVIVLIWKASRRKDGF